VMASNNQNEAFINYLPNSAGKVKH